MARSLLFPLSCPAPAGAGRAQCLQITILTRQGDLIVRHFFRLFIVILMSFEKPIIASTRTSLAITGLLSPTRQTVLWSVAIHEKELPVTNAASVVIVSLCPSVVRPVCFVHRATRLKSCCGPRKFKPACSCRLHTDFGRFRYQNAFDLIL